MLVYSHPVEVTAPENISFTGGKNIILIEGIDKEVVGQIAAKSGRFGHPNLIKAKE